MANTKNSNSELQCFCLKSNTLVTRCNKVSYLYYENVFDDATSLTKIQLQFKQAIDNFLPPLSWPSSVFFGFYNSVKFFCEGAQ